MKYYYPIFVNSVNKIKYNKSYKNMVSAESFHCLIGGVLKLPTITM